MIFSLFFFDDASFNTSISFANAFHFLTDGNASGAFVLLVLNALESKSSNE